LKVASSPRPRRAEGCRSFLAVLLLLGAFESQAFVAPQVKERALARITAYGATAGAGSGFRISSGHIVTAYHVVYGANRVDVTLAGQTYKNVTVVAVYPETDLALLRVQAPRSTGYYPTALADGGDAGAKVYVHGAPLGFDNQLLEGNRTQKGFLTSEQWADRGGKPLFRVRNLNLVPLDITSEAGMSGGPVMDAQGNVFGVFSGSLEVSGRGYSWAVPISYATLDHMQQLNKPASAIRKWPEFVYLRAGLSLLRSLHRDSEAARLANRCRLRIDEYEQAWESQLDVAHHYAMKWQIMKPHFESVLESTRADGPESQKSQVEFLFVTLEPQMTAFEKAQARFEQASSRLLTNCYSQTLLRSLFPQDFPTTRANVLFISKTRDRVMAINEKREKANEAGKTLEEKAKGMMEELFSLSGTFESSEDAKLIMGILRALALMETGITAFLSEEQADYIHGLAQGARSWTEIVEAIELHRWEREHQIYSYRDAAGIVLSLTNGWLRFDQELRDALTAPGRILSELIKAVKPGPLVNPTPPFAMALLAWHPSATTGLSWNPSTSPGTTDSSPTSLYWIFADSFWLAMQNAEGASYTNVQRYTNQMGNNLLLEMIGDATGASNEQYRVYLGLRFARNGTSALTCALLSKDVDYGSCTELQDSMRLPD